MFALRRKGEGEESDERILGSGDFVKGVLRDLGERQLRQLKLRGRGVTLGDIIDEDCGRAGVRKSELINGSRRGVVSDVREVVAHRYAEESGVSAAEIARRRGVPPSSITRAIARVEEQRGK